MADLDQLYTDLEQHLKSLKVTFLDDFLGDPTANPEDYELQVRAYCVLSHAALEEYFETVALHVLQETIDAWSTNGSVKDTLVAIVIHHFTKATESGSNVSKGKDSEDKVRDVHNLLNFVLNNARSWFRTYATKQNHGAGIKYLKKLLEPVGIDISNDIYQLASLATLVTQRGDVAHTFSKRITSQLAPQSLLNAVDDCLKLCDEVRVSAKAKLL